MKPEINNDRRRFMLTAASVAGAVWIAPAAMSSASTSASTDTNAGSDERDLKLATLDDALSELAALVQNGEPASSATWNWAQTLTHCAQSIEFSLAGFPQPKPELFQRTIGAAAYEVFAWRGRMTHDLAEPIPGAPSLEGVVDAAAAEIRLRASIAAFQQWQGELRPHFAYGELSREEYELAHAMHLASHFALFHARV